MPFPPTFTNVYDITFPPDTQLANLLGQDLRNLRLDLMQRMSLLGGTLANRPTPETINATWGGVGFGLLYFTTDTSQVFQWNGAAWTDVTGLVAGGHYKEEGVNIVSVTVGNSAVLTPLQGVLIPANDIGASQTFYFDVFGSVGSNGAQLTLGVYLDSILLGNIIMNPANAAGMTWSLRGFFTGLTTGVAGTVTGIQVLFISSNPIGSGFVSLVSPPGPLSVVLDTTIAHTLRLQALWASAAVANTITSNTMTVYRVG